MGTWPRLAIRRQMNLVSAGFLVLSSGLHTYASNLKMRFNLMTIEPGTLVLEKKLPEDVQIYGEQSFAYQIYTVSGGHQTLYTPPEGKVVTYEKTGAPVPNDQEGDRGFKSSWEINGQTYQNVYLLKPYEPIVIPMVSDDVEYFIREIGIPDVYKQVKANDRELTITDDRMAATDVESVKIRGRVTYENIPETHNLRLEKLVQGPILTANDSFRFDVQLEDSETGSLVPFNRGEYYVVKTNDAGVDQYYKYSDGQLVPSTEPVAYKAGPNGSIAQIYPGYTILIKGLLPGTDFKVTENVSSGEYPAGYSYVKKEVSNEAPAQISGADGRIPAQDELEGTYKDALVQITNTSSTDITLIKVDRDDLNEDNPNLLKGASFTLSKYTDEEFTVKDVSWGTDGSQTLSDELDPENGTYPLNGVFTFEGLTVGCYQLEEISFPDGYVKLSGNPTFKIEANASNGLQITLIDNPDGLLRLEGNKLTIIVGNTPGAVLPATGGPGTRLYTLSGIGLMALAAFMLLRKRARNTL